jgi:hypothetical protein
MICSFNTILALLFYVTPYNHKLQGKLLFIQNGVGAKSYGGFYPENSIWFHILIWSCPM